MYIEERGWVKEGIICKYAMFDFQLDFSNCHLKLSFQIFNVVPPVLLLYCNTPGVVLDGEHPYITQFPLSIIN